MLTSLPQICLTPNSTRETVLPAVVEKCLGATRAGTKKNGLELVLLYAENEDIMGSEGVVVSLSALSRPTSTSSN